MALMVFAVGMWAAVPVVLLFSPPGVRKVWATSALLVAGEVASWVSAAVLGRGVSRRAGAGPAAPGILGGRG